MISFDLKKPFNPNSAVDRHFDLLDSIKGEKDEEKLIQLCLEDIKLVEKFKYDWVRQAEKEADNMNLQGTARKKYIVIPPSYPSFKKLAIIYEKQKEYDKAIEVCTEAIKAGFSKDGTDGGMRWRIKKLKDKKKALKEKEKNAKSKEATPKKT